MSLYDALGNIDLELFDARKRVAMLEELRAHVQAQLDRQRAEREAGKRCGIPGCLRKHHARGMCQLHWNKWWRECRGASSAKRKRPPATSPPAHVQIPPPPCEPPRWLLDERAQRKERTAKGIIRFARETEHPRLVDQEPGVLVIPAGVETEDPRVGLAVTNVPRPRRRCIVKPCPTSPSPSSSPSPC